MSLFSSRPAGTGRKRNYGSHALFFLLGLLFSLPILRLSSHLPEQLWNVDVLQRSQGGAGSCAAPLNEMTAGTKHKGRPSGTVALCIYGTLDNVDLTMPGVMSSIPCWLGRTADAFVILPIGGQQIHKLTIFMSGGVRLEGMHVKSVDIGPDLWKVAQNVFNNSMPASDLGPLVQNWAMLDQCLSLVERSEETNGGRYPWVVTVHTDYFFGGGQLLPRPTLKRGRSLVPPPLRPNEGYPHLLGVWSRKDATAALKRMDMLKDLHKKGVRGRAPGQALKAWLDSQFPRVFPEFLPFPFCHLELGPGNGLVVPVGSPMAVSGVECRPCQRRLQGEDVWRWISRAMHSGKGMGAGIPMWVGTGPPELCDSGQPEDGDSVAAAFDAVAGKEAAQMRREVAAAGRASWQCVPALNAVAERVGTWRGPPPEALCVLRGLGSTEYVGTDYGGWKLFLAMLSSKSVLYSFGVGTDTSWDLAMIKKFGLEVHAFDNTPVSLAWLQKNKDKHPKNWVHHAFLLGSKDGNLTLSLPVGHWTSFSVMEASKAGFQQSKEVHLPARRLSTLMKMNGHKKLSVLKLDIEGAEFRVIADWQKTKEIPIACQLLIEFHGRLMSDGAALRDKAIEQLESMGFHLVDVYTDSFGADNCLFFHEKFCAQ